MEQKFKSLRPTYAEIDLKAFGYNLEQAKKLGGTDVITIIKADAYGHGSLRLAEYAALNHGVKRFGVATVLEAMILREHIGHEYMIYLLGYADSDFYQEILDYNLILPVYDDEIASSFHAFLEKKNQTADITLQIDTGMRRLGFPPSLNYHDFMVKYPRFRVCHVMSHLATADCDLDFSKYQKSLFDKFIQKNNIRTNTSLYSSAGIANLKNDYSLSRPGIMLYGYLYGEKKVALKKVMRIYSKVVHIQKIQSGDSVSYGRRFRAEREMTIGVVPIGYADGYLRCFSNRGKMFVNGVECPVLGTVCMDMTMIDLSNVRLDCPHPVVEILGDNITADHWAELAGTINYEVLCGIKERIPRIYKG